MDQKPQKKSLKRWYYPPSHHLNVSHWQSQSPLTRGCGYRTARNSPSCVAQLQMKDVRKKRALYSHGNTWLCSVHCAACCVAGEKSGGQECSFQRVLGTYSPAEMNSDGNVKQWCADCATEAEHCQKAGPKKARTHWASQAAVTLPFLSQLALSGLPLCQEQDIMHFYYAWHYHSVHLCFLVSGM